MFQKVLVANRGEIALRVIRACKELGVRTLAVYSEADVDSLHVQLADEAICIGAAPSLESYLKIDRIMSAAEIGDVDAIHPGYGFLAENPHFVEVCESCNIKFIGPSSRAMQSMGNKNSARAAARKIGVPVTPGSDGIIETEDDAIKIAKKLGYPVMIKAAAGGGGRGMRAAHNEPSLKSAFHSARHEAQKAFGDDQVYLEKLILNPRHIEFQIMADSHGHIIHLGERDCSIQRRNQKVIEECPSAAMTPSLRRKMGSAAVKLAKSVGYENAGTIEFLLDRDRHFYFMEMNTRIQVEHTVTEEVYGCDLVKEQIRIAAGEELSIKQDDLRLSGHAIECRINAEDAKTFMPSPGPIKLWHAPGGPGIRVDSHIYSGYNVPPHYDSLIAKVISYGDTRETAIARMRNALAEMVVEGIKTNTALHQEIFTHQAFRTGGQDIHYLERRLGLK